MGHFPLLLVIPHQIQTGGQAAVYQYIEETMKPFDHILYHRYSIGGQWDMYLNHPTSVTECVEIEMGLVSTLRYNMVRATQYMNQLGGETQVINDHQLTTWDSIGNVIDDYLVIIDCRI